MSSSKESKQHGIRATYVVDGCRCKPCSLANSEYLKKYRKERNAREETVPLYEYQKIARAALDWVIKNHPRVYKQLLESTQNG